eukprot:UC4_evm1s1442
MKATFIILGKVKSELKSWLGDIVPLISKTGKEGLKRKVKESVPKDIPLENSEAALSVLQGKGVSLQETTEASEAAAVFYCWAMTSIQESFENNGKEPPDFELSSNVDMIK